MHGLTGGKLETEPKATAPASHPTPEALPGLGVGQALDEESAQSLVAALVDLLRCGEEARPVTLW
jgi:hypothetical protein